MCIYAIVCVRKRYVNICTIVRELPKFGSLYGTVVKVNKGFYPIDRIL